MTIATPEILPKAVTSEDIQRLHELAKRLKGRPVPGVRMTEQEFEDWSQEDIRAEWIDGEVILLSPSNITDAQLILWLCRVLAEIAETDDLGELITGEVQARLEVVHQRRNPDILFVSRSRRQIIEQTYIDGPPDLIIEVVSPDSQVRDWHDKYLAYETSGVREYWLIDPRSRRIEAFHLNRSGKFVRIREVDGCVRSKVVKKFYLRAEWIWNAPMPKVSAILKELGVRG
jgi:Uma2 family endonuclease